jgi:hypothetical protein
MLYGNNTSQVIKDVLTDLHKLKGVSGGRAGMCACVRELWWSVREL